AERRHEERDGDDDAERPGCDHGSQPKSSHLSLACSAGSIVLATSPAALVAAWCQVTQPTVPRRVSNSIAVTRACGSSSFWVMLDLHLSVTLGIVPCRVHLLIHRRVRDRWVREASGAIVARIRCFGAASGSMN